MRLYLSKNIPKYMEEFIHFSCHQLGLDKLRGEISISLRGTLEGESFGLCWGDRREVEIAIASKQWGEPLSREDKLRTIAHELTHAWQYLTGALKCLPADGIYESRWQGMQYRYFPEDETTMPWEAEAIEQEKVIYSRWCGDDK